MGNTVSVSHEWSIIRISIASRNSEIKAKSERRNFFVLDCSDEFEKNSKLFKSFSGKNVKSAHRPSRPLQPYPGTNNE